MDNHREFNSPSNLFGKFGHNRSLKYQRIEWTVDGGDVLLCSAVTSNGAHWRVCIDTEF